MPRRPLYHPAPRLPGVLLGIGLGGFVDGIVLHQIMQWHNMLSAVDPPESMEAMRRNMFADGVFHAVTWLVTVAGVATLWREGRHGDAPPTAGALIGDVLLGWGLFNLVEGLIDHQLLGLHHVREVPGYLTYDLAFLAIGGLVLIAIGWGMGKRARRRSLE